MSDNRMLMIYGKCNHFWRKRNPMPRHGPIQQPNGHISLPPIAHFCKKCVDRINAADFKFMGYVAHTPEGWVPAGPFVPGEEA